MKIGVFAVLFGGKPFEETLDYIKELGLEAVEIGTGAYPGDAHCKPAELLKNDSKLKAFKEAIDRRGLTISALSCHGNPIHPEREDREGARRDLPRHGRAGGEARRRAGHHLLRLPRRRPEGDAAELDHLVRGRPSFPQMLEWQWKERVDPVLEGHRAAPASSTGVRVAIEMHPNFVVYNPETMLRLRDIAPGTIGCNFDPSHMFWQQVDVATAIRALGDSHLPRAREGLQNRSARTRR